jgi:6-phosphogluconolactonase (cycloisomerase 2 family)
MASLRFRSIARPGLSRQSRARLSNSLHRVHPDLPTYDPSSGKFLYAFNFNDDTLAAFTINSTTGALSPISGSPFAINPNAQGGLIVDPSGQFLYLTIGSSLNYAFVIFDIDSTTGALSPNSQSPVAGGEEPSGLIAVQFQ